MERHAAPRAYRAIQGTLETQLAARTSGTATEPLTMNELINELEDSPELELQNALETVLAKGKQGQD